MADNTAVKNASGVTISAATDELSDGSQSPKVSLLAGDQSPTPISPATSGKQDQIITALGDVLSKIIAAPATEAKQDDSLTALAAVQSAIEGTGAVSSDQLPAALGPQLSGDSLSITWASDLPGFSPVADALRMLLVDSAGTEVPSDEPVAVDPASTQYEEVAASQTAQVLGPTGAADDYISGILVTPTSISPGVVTLLDDDEAIPLFAGGSNSLSNLVPFFIPVNARSVNGAWKLTTGADLSCLVTGAFT